MSIPKLIFQTWKSKTDFPENFKVWSDTIRDVNPDYAYRLWDDRDNRAFIAKNYPWFLERYDSYPAEIYRADAVRYFFLYQFGGIYADMDVEALRPFDSVLEAGDVVLGRMGVNSNFEHSLPNALMMSAPRQEFWLLMMSLLLDPPKNYADNPRPEYTTGPVMLKLAHDLYTQSYQEDVVQMRIANIRARLPENAANKTRSRINAVPGNVFFPLDWNDRIHDNFVRRPIVEKNSRLDRESALALFPFSFTVTYWSHSWEPQ